MRVLQRSPLVIADDVLLGTSDGIDVGDADVAARLVMPAIGIVVYVTHRLCGTAFGEISGFFGA